MPRTSNKLAFPKLPRIRQKTIAHCGPAVLEMLLRFRDIRIDQDRFVKAAAVKSKLKRHGMNIADLGEAVQKLAPQMDFWFKQKATFTDLIQILRNYRTPVGVEWQGVFGKYSDGDDGHYGIVVNVNKRTKTLKIVDPFIHWKVLDRTFKLKEFEKRWWDQNEVRNPKTKKIRRIKDHHMLFVVTSKRVRFPQKLRMKQVKN